MRFFKGKISTSCFDFFRIAIALLALIHFYAVDKDYLSLYSSSGLVQPEMEHALTQKYVPNRNIVLHIGSFLHLSESTILQSVKYAYYIFLFFLLIGFVTRFSAFFCWLLHLILIKSAVCLSYGTDYFTTIAFVYCILIPVAGRLSVDRKLFHKEGLIDVFYLRMLQIHVCMIYFFAGFAKAIGNTWWNGNSIWRLLMRRPLGEGIMELLAKHMFILSIAGALIILIELLYSVLIWPRRTRKIMLVLSIIMHFFIGAFMGLYYFAAIMMVYNLAAFAFSGEKKIGR